MTRKSCLFTVNDVERAAAQGVRLCSMSKREGMMAVPIKQAKQAGMWWRAGLLAAVLAAPACASRLTLVIGSEPLGMSDGGQCEQADDKLPAVVVLTESDVERWDAQTAMWQLDSHRYPAADSGRLAERCFVLSLDGKLLSRGVVLPVDTPRLTGYQTLNLVPRGQALWLQLTAGNHHNIHLLYARELDAVLGTPTGPASP